MMARVKDTGVSAAFRERSDHERERLEGRLAKHLQEDMARLLDDSLHADLTLVLPGGIQIPLHSAIIKHRAPVFYNKYIMGFTGTSVTLETDDVPGLQAFIRSVYTDDQIQPSPWNGTDRDCGRMMSNPGEPVTSDVATITTSNVLDANGNDNHQDSTAIEHSESDVTPRVEGGDGSVRNCEPDERSLQAGCCPLGSSLLSMYQLGTGTDVIFIADGQRFSAHRSILCARSSYFSAMLSGGWRESSTQEITLERVSAGVLEQALLFVYGGGVDLSPACNLGELVVVGDMYGIAGIKDITTFLLKRDYCHFFHKPCSGCLVGVCETLPLTFTFGLGDLQERCLRWATRYFIRLWPTKQFALLPPEVLEKCYSEIANDITPSSVLDLVLEADQLNGAIPQVRWAEPVTAMTTRLIEACISHLGTHLVNIMATQRFLSMATTMALGLDLLLGVMRRAITVMPVEHACRTYLQCASLAQRTYEVDCDWNEDFCSLVRAVYAQCEQYMHQYVHLVVGSLGWKLLSPTDQAKIKEGGCFVVPEEAKKPLHKPHSKKAGAGAASRPTMLPSQHRARGGRPGGSSKTPSPAGASSASSGGQTPQTPSNSRNGTSPRSPGQTKLSPRAAMSTATTSGTSRTKLTSPTTTKRKPPTFAQQSEGSFAVSNSVAEVAAGPSGNDGPNNTLPPLVTGTVESVEQAQGACSEALLQATAKKYSNGRKPQSTGKVPADTAVGKAKGTATPSKLPSGVVANKTQGSGTNPKPRPAGSVVTRKADTGATHKGRSVNSFPSKHVGGTARLQQGSVPSPAATRPLSAPSTVPAQRTPASTSVRSKLKTDQPASSAKGQALPMKKSLSSSSRDSQRPETKNAKMAANEMAANFKIASLNKVKDTRKKIYVCEKAKLPHLRKTKPKPNVPENSSNREDYHSRSSSGSSVSTPRSAGSTSRLPVASKLGTRRDSDESANKENDAVFAKCTSMRIAAMTNKKQVDADIDCETESVISTLSHIAVKGSRTPSIADMDLSPNEYDTEDLYNGTSHHHSGGLSLDRLDGGRLAATYEELELPAPEEHNDVIVPVFDAIFTAPCDVTKNR